MAHSLASPPPTTAAATSISTAAAKKTTRFRSVGFQNVRASDQVSDDSNAANNNLVHRRNVGLGLGLAGAVLSFTVGDPNSSANAAARRPPPPPAEDEKEKKDPNVSGVLAKVLASKKRKEAMKQSVAKLRERGKPIQAPSE